VKYIITFNKIIWCLCRNSRRSSRRSKRVNSNF